MPLRVTAFHEGPQLFYTASLEFLVKAEEVNMNSLLYYKSNKCSIINVKGIVRSRIQSSKPGAAFVLYGPLLGKLKWASFICLAQLDTAGQYILEYT